jgi:Domain of unknown function (DUF4351)
MFGYDVGLEKAQSGAKQFLFNFVDNYLELLESEQSTFEVGLRKLAPKKKVESMKLMNSYVRKGIAEGIEVGKAEGKMEMVSRLLKRKVGELPTEVEVQVLVLPLEKLEALGEALLDFNTLADLENWLVTQV